MSQLPEPMLVRGILGGSFILEHTVSLARASVALGKFTALAIAIGLVGCAPSAWNTAERANTVAEYQRFAMEHPEDARVSEAQIRASELAYQQALLYDSIPAWAAYLRVSPDGSHLAEASARIAELELQDDSAAFIRARSAGGVDALKEFLKGYPGSQHAPEAWGIIDTIETHRWKARGCTGGPRLRDNVSKWCECLDSIEEALRSDFQTVAFWEVVARSEAFDFVVELRQVVGNPVITRRLGPLSLSVTHSRVSAQYNSADTPIVFGAKIAASISSGSRVLVTHEESSHFPYMTTSVPRSQVPEFLPEQMITELAGRPEFTQEDYAEMTASNNVHLARAASAYQVHFVNAKPGHWEFVYTLREGAHLPLRLSEQCAINRDMKAGDERCTILPHPGMLLPVDGPTCDDIPFRSRPDSSEVHIDDNTVRWTENCWHNVPKPEIGDGSGYVGWKVRGTINYSMDVCEGEIEVNELIPGSRRVGRTAKYGVLGRWLSRPGPLPKLAK